MTNITATTVSKVRTKLTAYLNDVTTKNTEVHIVLPSGKNAVLIAEDELNELRQQLLALETARVQEERANYLADPKTKRYNSAAEMHDDLLGDLYDQLPD